MKGESLKIKDAIHRLQLSLLEGIKHEDQLSIAGSLMSQSDYQDVVSERIIANMCGYPLCSNLLPSERPWKGNYHVSLKEHKVYDLKETYKYCSSGCLINSQAFMGSLLEERSTMSGAKINEILNYFQGLDSTVNIGETRDLGFSELKIMEKTDVKSGEVSLEEWIGPSNAIEGYVPQRDENLKPPQLNNLHDGARISQNDMLNHVNFTSTIITQDEYSISKHVPSVQANESKEKLSTENVNYPVTAVKKKSVPVGNVREDGSTKSGGGKKVNPKIGKQRVRSESPATIKNNHNSIGTCSEKELCWDKEPFLSAKILKSSLKDSDSKKSTRTVSWADEKTRTDRINLLDYSEVKDNKGDAETPESENKEVHADSYRIESAEACVRALSQAAEAVMSGKSDASVAVSEADVTILPATYEFDETKSRVNAAADAAADTNSVLKWPMKSGISNDNLIDTEDSWYDSPPDGFSLTLSPFSTMFMALFSWISSSSLAYIYGKDERFHEDYLSVNGREYPRKVVMTDGRSSEIKQTLSGCLARALPGLVAELRLSTPISTLEQGIGRILDTMSFLDPLPPFRIKQWQVVIFLFLDALSVTRIPAITPYMTDRRILLPKVLEGAHISSEEYEIMKDLIIPLDPVTQFLTQSGG